MFDPMTEMWIEAHNRLAEERQTASTASPEERTKIQTASEGEWGLVPDEWSTSDLLKPRNVNSQSRVRRADAPSDQTDADVLWKADIETEVR